MGTLDVSPSDPDTMFLRTAHGAPTAGGRAHPEGGGEHGSAKGSPEALWTQGAQPPRIDFLHDVLEDFSELFV